MLLRDVACTWCFEAQRRRMEAGNGKTNKLFTSSALILLLNTFIISPSVTSYYKEL